MYGILDFLDFFYFLYCFMKAFIFDFDGVIVDSERYWRIIGDAQFFPSIIPGWSTADGAKMMGLGLKTGYKLLVDEYGLTMGFDEYWIELNRCVDDIYTHKAQPLPGLHDLIARLAAMHIPLGVASSSQRHWIEPTLKRLDLEQFFSAICGANDVNERTKPLPDVYLLAAERLGVSPQECVAMEDSKMGLSSAKNAGMKAIAIRTRMNPEQDLSQADMEITHYDQLMEEVLKNL